MRSNADQQQLAQPRVLVTGASGFIGRAVMPVLARRGHELHAVSRRPQDGMAGVTWHTIDLSDYAEVDRLLEEVRPTHLLHLAWETTHGSYYTTPENVRCLIDALHLVKAFAARGGKRFVGAGSGVEYDFSVAGDFVEDVTPVRPNGLYGECKKALFEVAAKLADQSGFQCAWGRVFFAYGPGEHPSRMVPTLIRDLGGRDRVPFQAGAAIRDYVYVEDIAEAFAQLVHSDFRGAMNIGSGRPIALRAFVSALATAFGRPDAVEFGALPTPAYEPARVVADTKRVRTELGWAPRRTLEEELRETVAWWRERSGREAVIK